MSCSCVWLILPAAFSSVDAMFGQVACLEVRDSMMVM